MPSPFVRVSSSKCWNAFTCLFFGLLYLAPHKEGGYCQQDTKIHLLCICLTRLCLYCGGIALALCPLGPGTFGLDTPRPRQPSESQKTGGILTMCLCVCVSVCLCVCGSQGFGSSSGTVSRPPSQNCSVHKMRSIWICIPNSLVARNISASIRKYVWSCCWLFQSKRHTHFLPF